MATSDLAGRRLVGRYVLQERISAGGMATVWRARDEVLGRDVALKILHDELASDEDILERFRLEAVASARLGDPAVVRVFDTGVDDGVCFIVMELFGGETVAMLLDRQGPLPAQEACSIARGALRGLGHAHATGIVHRDVKPSNILIGTDGSVKVTDFGIAKAAFAGSDLTTTGNLLGTAKYLAPEQVQEGGVDARSDLYAVGVVLYELLTGRPPFEAETHIATATMRLTTDPPPLRSLRPDLAPEVEEVVMKALARDPDERFQSADEFAAALDRAAGTAVAEAPPRAPRPTRREARAARPPSTFRSWVYIPLLLVLLAAMGFAGYVLVQELGRPEGTDANGPAAQPRPLEIVDAFDHDPHGGDGEYPELAGDAADGDPDTEWHTEGYNSPDLDKPGVGIVFDLGDPVPIREVTVHTNLPGWTFVLQGSDDRSSYSPPIADVDGETRFVSEPETRIALEAEYRYVMVWITGLVLDPTGDYRATVAEVEILGERG